MKRAQDRSEWRMTCKVGKKLDRIRKKALDPSSFIGQEIEKLFRGKWFAGKIDSSDIDALTAEVIWHVQYDDGDSEDFNFSELHKVLIERDSIGYLNPADQKTARAKRLQRRQGQTAGGFAPEEPPSHLNKLPEPLIQA